MSSTNQTDFIIPEREFREKILTRLSEQPGNFNPESIGTAIAIFAMTNDIQNALNLHFSRYRLTQARFVLLLTMFSSDKKAWFPAELAAAIRVKPPTMTGILDGLVKEGYVKRTADEKDRRKVIVSLTTNGKKKIESVMPDHFQRISRAFANLLDPQIHNQINHITIAIQNSLQTLLEGVKE